MSDTIEQHQEQPPAGERSPELPEGCYRIAVAAPERVRGRPFPPGVSGNPAGRLRQNPKTHRRLSLREVAANLADKGMVTKSGTLYSAAAVRRMLLLRTSVGAIT